MTAARLEWSDIEPYTAMLFLHNHSAPPPSSVRQLWTAVANAGLNSFENEVEQTVVKVRLMSLALAQQEFRLLVFRAGSTIQPLDIVSFLGAPFEHLAPAVELASLSPQGGPLEDVLQLDSMNRKLLHSALEDEFGDAEAIFKLFAFPNGLPDSVASLSVAELLAQAASQQEPDEMTAQLVGEPMVQAGFDFIADRFQRKIEYGPM